jgi:peptidoglycan/LPS O-acetylase OafA/YrhL
MWINFALAYPLAFSLAIVSWWMVEKPAMNLKSVMYKVEDRLLRLRMVAWHSRYVFGMATKPIRLDATQSTPKASTADLGN